MRSPLLFRVASITTLFLHLFGLQSFAAPPDLQHVPPEAVGMDASRLSYIDQVVQEGLDRNNMPGCVVLVGRQGRIAMLKAYGHKQVEPERAAMTTDTVFDLASLTKPIATATSIMTLIEQGRVELDEPVAAYLPDFGTHGKEAITIRQLLTHQGGLIPDNALRDYEEGHDEALRRLWALKPQADPGTKFIYSDVGFILLGEVVRAVTGQDVHAYSQENIFGPLGMRETGYLPSEELRRRAAVTEKREGQWMRGEVHDPRAFLLGGVAGHAGLFSTAKDLARYAQMMLGDGQLGDTRVLKPETVELMTRPEPVSRGLRALGWDVRTRYSSNRGDLCSDRAFGHGGFTGTVMWIDPELELFVIFLSNRVHPDGKGSVNPLAGRIGTLAAAAITDSFPPAPASLTTREVLTGIDVLVRDKFQRLRGRRVGLITNHTGVARDGISTVELLHQAADVELVALFSPEHGIAGQLDVARIADSQDDATGLKVFSLYGETRTPTAENLQGIDTLVFDIQDIGARFYTYVSTMGNAMRAAAEQGVRFVVLDRPNPIGGLTVQGPVLDAGSESFVGFHRLPVRHGMTVGELARMFKDELELDLELEVIAIEGWRREELFDATGLVWVNPSPNMRGLTQALLYPGIGILETTNLSVGRGTDTPFEVVGAPWISCSELARELNDSGLPGVTFVPLRFTPDASKYKDEPCEGVNIIITDRSRFDPLRTGVAFALCLRELYPNQWNTASLNRLLGNRPTYDAILAGQPLDAIMAGWEDSLDAFRVRRTKFLTYE